MNMENSKIKFTKLALENLQETGVDYTDDLHDLRTGQVSVSELLAKCLDGADDDRVTGWQEYVETLDEATRSSPHRKHDPVSTKRDLVP
jgi:hypothetical protein